MAGPNSYRRLDFILIVATDDSFGRFCTTLCDFNFSSFLFLFNYALHNSKMLPY